ncbi:hypothetical protein ABMA28_013746 [Loxostege sticticalis]|uniref:HAT C-terminal dimerisation domain-containing protein n=1 Tax=Loxostege sticticalis TaxID=481309 RepID=A0ABD0TJF0_LOXSC
MAGDAKKSRIMQRFNEDWLTESSFRAWLTRSKKGVSFAYCKYCLVDLSIGSGGKKDIFKHMKTTKHENSVPTSSQRSMTTFLTKNNEGVKKGEILMAAFVAEHNLSMNVMEHMPQLIKNICTDSDIAKDLSCGRTKTTALIKSVTGKTAENYVIEQCRNRKFSLIVDESTDMGCIKHLCMVVRYYDEKVTDTFLGLIPLQDATAQILYDHIVKFFADNEIPYRQNMIGFASDGANTMMGQHNSLASRFLTDIPHLYLVKCICHSFHLCASYACLKLAREPEDLIRDIYNYFNSPKRSAQLKEFQEFMNLKPHKLLHPSQTRWLSVRAAVSRLLEQYQALILYFTDAAFTDRLRASDNILHMLKNPYNKLYLEFLEFSLKIFNDLNQLMQSERPQIHKLHENVCVLYKNLLDCYIKDSYLTQTELQNVEYANPRNFKALEEMYLGAKVAMTVATNSAELNPSDVTTFKLRCLDFYIEGAKQIKSRYKFDNNIAKKMEFLNPDIVKARKVQSVVDLALFFPNIIDAENIQDLDTEWRHLRNNTELRSTDSGENIEEFWKKIMTAINSGDGNLLYPVLTSFISALLSLPHSSASVERIFSAINLMKTKQRNKLCTETIAGLLHTKTLLRNAPCFDLNVNLNMLKLMNKNMYK